MKKRRFTFLCKSLLLHLLTQASRASPSKLAVRGIFEGENWKMKKVFIAALMTVALSSALFAQGRRGGPRGGGDATTALKDALGLTDAQVTAINALIQTEQTRMQAIRTEIDQKRQALDTLLSTASPAPIEVGNAAISLHASEAKI